MAFPENFPVFSPAQKSKGIAVFFRKLPKEISSCFTSSRLNAAYARANCPWMEKWF